MRGSASFSVCFSLSGEDANGQWDAERWAVGERAGKAWVLDYHQLSSNKETPGAGAPSVPVFRTGTVVSELSLPVNDHFLPNSFGGIKARFKLYLCFFFNLGGQCNHINMCLLSPLRRVLRSCQNTHYTRESRFSFLSSLYCIQTLIYHSLTLRFYNFQDAL